MPTALYGHAPVVVNNTLLTLVGANDDAQATYVSYSLCVPPFVTLAFVACGQGTRENIAIRIAMLCGMISL